MKKIPVIVIGAGGVGRALLEQIVSGREVVAQRNQVHFAVVAVADSKKWVWDSAEIPDETLLEIVNLKKTRKEIGSDRPDIPEIVAQVEAAGHKNAILVDVTALEGMEPALTAALDAGYGVALANKKAMAGPLETASQFFNHPRVRHESTVGGGQPVIATMRYLCDTSDAPSHIEGQLSGTLGYICQRLDEGVLMSRAIAEAKAKGFTEPDPREDLSGMDVMRKVMILGRMAGWQLEADDIKVESLYSSSLAHLSVPEFMASAVALDPSMSDRVAAAAAEGNVLRYLATVTKDGGTVGLQAVPKDSPLANLKYISFRTANYDDEPLLICGKGAGVEMTAAGVHGDMISLAREM